MTSGQRIRCVKGTKAGMHGPETSSRQFGGWEVMCKQIHVNGRQNPGQEFRDPIIKA